jgi:hypothetical protein
MDEAEANAGKNPGCGGCAMLLIFFVIETAAGIAVGALCYVPLSMAIGAIVPATEADFAAVCAICLSFVPALLAMMAIDRLCKTLTGHSVFAWLPDIPSFP